MFSRTVILVVLSSALCGGSYAGVLVSGAIHPIDPEIAPPAPEKCGYNEEPGCQGACDVKCPSFDMQAPTECPPCQPGCVCLAGYVRDFRSGLCVGQDFCPIPEDPCVTNEIFSICGAGCQLTCEHPLYDNCKICIPGYVCRKGFVRDTYTGRCIKQDQCPPPCVPTENIETYSKRVKALPQKRSYRSARN